MKKFLLLFISALFLSMIFIECKKENDDHKAKDLYGTWEVTHLFNEEAEQWNDITKPYSVELRKNGTFQGRDVLWGFSGTYEVKENTIYGYGNLENFPAKCEIQELDLNTGTAEVDVYLTNKFSDLTFYCSVKLKRK